MAGHTLFFVALIFIRLWLVTNSWLIFINSRSIRAPVLLMALNESISSVLQAGEYLDEQYMTEKILNILGDGDKAEEILGKMESDELERGGVTVDEAEEGQWTAGNREDTQ